MSTAAPFHQLDAQGPCVPVHIDGVTVQVPDGMNLAAALLTAGIDVFRRTPVSGAPRAPFCMMGACFDCLVEIEGSTRQACLLEVRAGLVIRRPTGTTAHDSN